MTIVSLNKVTVTGCTPEEYERVYREASDFMAAQPGHISQRLVRSETEANVYFAIAEWESLEDYRALAGIQELVDIFGQVVTLPGASSPGPDKIIIEHHDAVVVSTHVPV
ncbi:antibiotic biosynthesis monooxygenase family protein [Streptosporangium sp. NPDC051023]|uniref:antibiotic biosynthesis monooxygenase family protein n=1 Tax=Streptosporangium sp. NPDC051023 TaxID=3155410 RepID=UPI00344C7DE2